MSLPVPVAPAQIVSQKLASGLAKGAELARAATSVGTRLAYQAAFSDFAEFCDGADARLLPADPATVIAYIADLHERGFKAATVALRLAAIGWAHLQAGHANPCHHVAVRQTHKGLRRTIGTAQTQKAPATAKIIGRMLKGMPPGLKGLRDRALILIGFAGGLRRSELVALNFEDVRFVAGGVELILRRSKTDQEGRGKVRPIPDGTKLLPVKALREWLDAAGITEGPVFREVRKGGELRGRLTGKSVARVVKQRALAAKLDPTQFAGHSLRAGILTSALEAGADIFAAADLGGWAKLETVRGYDRRMKALAQHAGRKFL